MKSTKLLEGICCSIPIGISILSKTYHGTGEHFVRFYLHDITFPCGIYFFNKLFNIRPVSENNYLNASYVFLGCSAMEAAQGLGLELGTFDPKDFLAYAAGTGLALLVDRLTLKKRN